MRYSIFSVNDHHPRLPRTVPQLDMGVRHVATMHNFGALAPELVEGSMTLFANEVMPAVASRVAARENRHTGGPDAADRAEPLLRARERP